MPEFGSRPVDVSLTVENIALVLTRLWAGSVFNRCSMSVKYKKFFFEASRSPRGPKYEEQFPHAK